VGIVINIILLSFFLFAPQFMGGYVGVYTSGNASTTIVPFFDVEAVKSVWWLFVISFGADIVNNIYKLIVGRWNVKTAIFNAVCNVVTAVASAIILLGRNIFCYYIAKDINSALAAAGEAPLPEQAALMFGRLNIIIFAIILFASVLSIITGFVKAFAAKEKANMARMRMNFSPFCRRVPQVVCFLISSQYRLAACSVLLSPYS